MSVRALANYAIRRATLVTLAPLVRRQTAPAAVSDDDLGVVAGGALLVRDGTIAYAGPESGIAAAALDACGAPDFEEFDARGACVLPGFVDAHTHALFAGNRVADFEAIAAGRPPALGIRYTVAQTRLLDADGLVAAGHRTLGLMAREGTTTAEVKTGYGLTADSERAMLVALDRLDRTPDLPHVVATFCGAHALPPEFDDYDRFTDELCARIVPAVAALGIARYADAFCERGYFTHDQTRRYMHACAAAGMRPRLHADELAPGGTAGLAAELGCASADHLNYVSDGDIKRLAAAGTVAVLCPATAEYLALERSAPARALIAAGVPVALATDFNPGTSPCCSLQVVAHLARRRLGLTVAETIAGICATPAACLGLHGAAGSLVVGARGDAVVLQTGDLRELGYYYGSSLVEMTVVAPAGRLAM